MYIYVCTVVLVPPQYRLCIYSRVSVYSHACTPCTRYVCLSKRFPFLAAGIQLVGASAVLPGSAPMEASIIPEHAQPTIEGAAIHKNTSHPGLSKCDVTLVTALVDLSRYATNVELEGKYANRNFGKYLNWFEQV